MTKYKGSYLFQGHQIPLTVSFSTNIVDERVNVSNFTANFDNFTTEIFPLVKGNKIAENALHRVLSTENSNISNYGDGSHAVPKSVQYKIDLWGQRTGVQKCYISNEGSGYFNTGTSGISITNSLNEKETPFESGLLKSEKGDAKILAGVVSAVNCLMHDLHTKNPELFSSNKGSYTTSPKNKETIDMLLAGGFEILPVISNSDNNEEAKSGEVNEFLSQVVQNSKERFKIDIDNERLLEKSKHEYVEKSYLFYDYNFPPAGMELVGEIEANVENNASLTDWCNIL